jgi:hypothetical protein
VKLEAAVPGDRWGLVGAASTKLGRSRTAGWAGPGERDGKVYARNRCCYASSRNASSNPVDVGWFAAQTRCAGLGGKLLVRYCSLGSGGHGEGLRRSRGDAAGVEPDTSPVDRMTVNVGTTSLPFHRLLPTGVGGG